MNKKQWYESLFENYAKTYDKECFTKIEIFGAKIGAYSRNDKLTTEDFEMLVVAEKYI